MFFSPSIHLPSILHLCLRAICFVSQPSIISPSPTLAPTNQDLKQNCFISRVNRWNLPDVITLLWKLWPLNAPPPDSNIQYKWLPSHQHRQMVCAFKTWPTAGIPLALYGGGGGGCLHDNPSITISLVLKITHTSQQARDSPVMTPTCQHAAMIHERPITRCSISSFINSITFYVELASSLCTYVGFLTHFSSSRCQKSCAFH